VSDKELIITPPNFRSEIRSKPLRDVFNSGQKRSIDVHIARLAVLYEDFRIESKGASALNIPELDMHESPGQTIPKRLLVGAYRKHYFMRRAIGTLSEYAEALYRLNTDPDFTTISNLFSAGEQGLWTKAIAFFDQNHRWIKDVRNDIGGHFGEEAARHAVGNIEDGCIGQIEFLHDEADLPRNALLHFSAEIAATAMLRNAKGTSIEDKALTLFDRLLEGFTQATVCVQILITKYLWDRFDSSSVK
jgi:hypothetical protein